MKKLRRGRRGFGDAARPVLTKDAAYDLLDDYKQNYVEVVEVELRRRCQYNAKSVFETLQERGAFWPLSLYAGFANDLDRVDDRDTERIEQVVDAAWKHTEKYTAEADRTVDRALESSSPLAQRCEVPKPPVRKFAKPSPTSKAFADETDALCSSWKHIGKKAEPRTDCGDVEYKVGRSIASMVEIKAFVGARGVGEMTLQVFPKQRQLVVSWSSSIGDYASCGVGRELYEVARRYGCEKGLKLASDTTRSPFSECFWRRQLVKGRAKCSPPDKYDETDGKVFEFSPARKDDPVRALAPYRSPIMQGFIDRGRWTCGQYQLNDPCPPADDPSLRGLGVLSKAGERRVDKALRQLEMATKRKRKKARR